MHVEGVESQTQWPSKKRRCTDAEIAWYEWAMATASSIRAKITISRTGYSKKVKADRSEKESKWIPMGLPRLHRASGGSPGTFPMRHRRFSAGRQTEARPEAHDRYSTGGQIQNTEATHMRCDLQAKAYCMQKDPKPTHMSYALEAMQFSTKQHSPREWLPTLRGSLVARGKACLGPPALANAAALLEFDGPEIEKQLESGPARRCRRPVERAPKKVERQLEAAGGMQRAGPRHAAGGGGLPPAAAQSPERQKDAAKKAMTLALVTARRYVHGSPARLLVSVLLLSATGLYLTLPPADDGAALSSPRRQALRGEAARPLAEEAARRDRVEADGLVRGAAPGAAQERLARARETGGFTCLDGSYFDSIEVLNDDFCDCPDGSDEPGTSACSGVLASPSALPGFSC
ncbi:unnamed protein product, partial [Prorocentrum cordatum]